MKKIVIGILVAMILVAQGVAFAEAVTDVKAEAEDAVATTENVAAAVVEETAAVPSDELVVPAESVKEEVEEEAKQM